MGQDQGGLRLSATVVEAYRRQYEGIDVQFEEATSERSLGRVIGGEIDIAFVTGSPKIQGCVTEQLWNERIFVALPSEHPLATGQEVRWDEIHVANCGKLVARSPGRPSFRTA